MCQVSQGAMSHLTSMNNITYEVVGTWITTNPLTEAHILVLKQSTILEVIFYDNICYSIKHKLEWKKKYQGHGIWNTYICLLTHIFKPHSMCFCNHKHLPWWQTSDKELNGRHLVFKADNTGFCLQPVKCF